MSRKAPARSSEPVRLSQDEINAEIAEYDKPAWQESDSSLDPVSDLEEFLEHELKLPPSTYDDLQRVIATRTAELEAAKQLTLPQDAQAAVQKRQQLVQGQQLEEVKRLKLKAYHRFMDKLQAVKDIQDKQETSDLSLALHGAPIDVVSADDVFQSPADVVHQQARQQDLDSGFSYPTSLQARQEANRPRDCCSPGTLEQQQQKQQQMSSSDDSDVDEQCRKVERGKYSQYVLGGLALRLGIRPAAEMQQRLPSASATSELGPTQQYGDASGHIALKTVYTPQMLQRQRLAEKLAFQRRRSKQAFLVPLLGMLCVSGYRWVRRRRTGGKGSGNQPAASTSDRSQRQRRQ